MAVWVRRVRLRPLSRWRVPSAPAGGSQALSGTAASATWTVVSATLVAGSVALSGAAASATWTVPTQALNATAALSGTAATSTWTVPTQTLAPGSVALSGTAATATWTVPSQTLAPGSVALSGTAAVSTWTIDTQTLTPGAVALSGTAATSTWTVPTQSLAAGSVALSGTAASSTWTVPTQSLSSGATALSGAAATATWTVPTQTLAPGSAALSGTAASATWTVPTQTLNASGSTTLSGTAASVTWVVPTSHTLTGGVRSALGLDRYDPWAITLKHREWMTSVGQPLVDELEDLTAGIQSGFKAVLTARRRFALQTPQWDEVRIASMSIRAPGAGTDPTFDSADGRYSFSASATNMLAVQIQLPAGWDEGTDVVPTLRWSPTTTGTGTVYWQLTYKVAGAQGSFPADWTTVSEVAPTNGVADQHLVTDFLPISMAGQTLSCLLLIKVTRLGSASMDTYADAVKLNTCGVRYRRNALGSTTATLK